jgi:hypothetical protein
MLPELIACLSCGFPRTLRVGTKRVCFQCRFNWTLEQTRPAPVTVSVAAAELARPHSFTSSELARLQIYRAAIQAGFYTDSEDA